ncbi:hypothetical protein SLS63_009565 [Diaporthe eres]|uniref:Uncharacterized protein n=1 Tax=Diaporthe eres TaxID=83184 RepID=A0ABR1NZB2_DIAER
MSNAHQNRRIVPEAGESSSKRPAPKAFEDAQVTQVTESFGILTTSHSQARGYGLPPATTSSHQSTTGTANLDFSTENDSTIISLMGAGWTVHQIKNEYFPHQDNVTPWSLKCRAQTLGAFWKEPEDKRLSEMELGQRESREVPGPIEDEYFSDPRREIRDIQVRYNQGQNSMTFGNKYSEIMQASDVSEDSDTSQHDMVDQDPGQYAYQYQHCHKCQDPGQDPNQYPNQYLNDESNTHQVQANYQTTKTGGLRRTEESIIAFIEEKGFFWTQEDDDELRESMREDHSLDPEVVDRLVESGKRFEDEVLNRAKALTLWEQFSASTTRSYDG